MGTAASVTSPCTPPFITFAQYTDLTDWYEALPDKVSLSSSQLLEQVKKRVVAFDSTKKEGLTLPDPSFSGGGDVGELTNVGMVLTLKSPKASQSPKRAAQKAKTPNPATGGTFFNDEEESMHYVCFSDDEDNDMMLIDLKFMASQGDKDAAFDLGVVYHTGSYKQKKNGNEMVKWWEKAAEEEVCDAVYNLAMVYHHGFKSEQDPVEVDLEKAAEWYLKAADLGRKEARGFAAECKAVIEGRKQRELEEMGKGEGEGDQALQYYELAAEGGDVPAMFKLGNCHAKGNLGQEVDYVKACEWWAKAAGEGHVLSTENILEHAGFNTKELKTDEILEDKLKEAMPKITGILANMYRWGNGVERDEGKCMELYKRSARMGNAESMFVLGAINDGGEFLSIGEKKEEGKAWMRKARDAGDARAKKWCRDYDR